MRVLALGNMYPPHHLGGYELCWHGVTHQLRAEGHATRILTTDYRRGGVAIADEPGIYRELRWYWRDHEWLVMAPSERLRLERRNAAIFDRHLREFEPDLIAWWAVGGMSLGLIERARQAQLPAILFVHDYWPAYGPERDLWTRMWRARPMAGAVVERVTGLPTRPRLEAAGRWLFNSGCTLRETLATGLDIRDSGVLSPGIDRDYLQARRESSTPAWRWRLLYLGRVVEQKGVRTAIEALALLPEEATLRIIGEGDRQYRDLLYQAARELGLAERVQLGPAVHREDLIGTYRSADAIVFPVQWPEPWGLVPLEAMALGRPVVATGRGGSADYLEDRVNTVLFEAGDPAALAAAISELAADSALRERLRENGYRTAAHHSAEEFNRKAIDEMTAIAAGVARSQEVRQP